MFRLLLISVALIAVLWMMLPMIHAQRTEMAFAAGDPDPNVYKTTHEFGWPLTWITWEGSWNEAAGYDESGVDFFSVVNLVIHVLTVTVPVYFYISLQRSESPGESDT